MSTQPLLLEKEQRLRLVTVTSRKIGAQQRWLLKAPNTAKSPPPAPPPGHSKDQYAYRSELAGIFHLVITVEEIILNTTFQKGQQQ